MTWFQYQFIKHLTATLPVMVLTYIWLRYFAPWTVSEKHRRERDD